MRGFRSRKRGGDLAARLAIDCQTALCRSSDCGQSSAQTALCRPSDVGQSEARTALCLSSDGGQSETRTALCRPSDGGQSSAQTALCRPSDGGQSSAQTADKRRCLFGWGMFMPVAVAIHPKSVFFQASPDRAGMGTHPYSRTYSGIRGFGLKNFAIFVVFSVFRGYSC